MRLAAEFSKATKQRNIMFTVFTVALVFLFVSYLQQLIPFSFNHRHYSHMLSIPFVSLYLFYLDRHNGFSRVQYSTRAGTTVLLAGIIIYLAVVNWDH